MEPAIYATQAIEGLTVGIILAMGMLYVLTKYGVIGVIENELREGK